MNRHQINYLARLASFDACSLIMTFFTDALAASEAVLSFSLRPLCGCWMDFFPPHPLSPTMTAAVPHFTLAVAAQS